MPRTITRTELADALARGEVVLIDALPESYYAQQHLPGALNLVEAEVADRAAALLPDKSAAIVTYCSNTSCHNSTAVAVALTRLGYSDVRCYADGIQDWVEAGLPTESGLATADRPVPAG